MTADSFRPLSASVGPIVERLRRLDLIEDRETVALLDRHRPAHPPRDSAAMIAGLQELIVEILDRADARADASAMSVRHHLEVVRCVGDVIAALQRLALHDDYFPGTRRGEVAAE
jgi:hypothetical protein